MKYYFFVDFCLKLDIFIVISGTVVVVIMMTLIVITGVIVFWRQHSVPVLNLKFKSKGIVNYCIVMIILLLNA